MESGLTTFTMVDFSNAQPHLSTTDMTSETEEVLQLRFQGPLNHYEKTIQSKCDRVGDLSRLQEIGFHRPVEWILDSCPDHPDIPRFRSLWSLYDDTNKKNYLVVRTKTGGWNLWNYDELYCHLHDWTKCFDDQPELEDYPLNDHLRMMPQYVWDEGDIADGYHLFFFVLK